MNKQFVFDEITKIWNEKIPFNRLIGLTITQFSPDIAEVQFNWQDNLVGNPVQKILHGGVTAAALDFTGGVVCAANIINNMTEITPETVTQQLMTLGTIDLRTDYLRPGRGDRFIVTACIIRAGKKVAVARMEMHNDQGEHLAFGTGTYMVG
jgi:uncharacterized protein (TIGR00369 family)